ncbi:MAG: hypothetical protein ACREDK_03600 [Thermoplasmata archaeon]
MALALRELPKFLVLEPGKGVRLDVELEQAACEIDLALDNPRPGRSFVALVGHVGGPIVQRARLAGSARLFFAPERAGEYVIYLTNPMEEAAVVHLAARDVPASRVRASSRPRRGVVRLGIPRLEVNVPVGRRTRRRRTTSTVKRRARSNARGAARLPQRSPRR